MVQAVIFDMDGVLMNSEDIHYRVERDILHRFNIDFRVEEHTQYVGQRTIDLWTGVCKHHGIDVDPLVLAKEDNQNYMKSLLEDDFLPIEGIVELIALLKSNEIPMIVASSANRDNIEIVMNKFSLNEDFIGYVSGQDVSRPKPNPDIFLLASEKLGIKPEHCLVIEDAKHGVHAAKSAGMTCVGYRNPSSGEQDLTMADAVVDSIYDINLQFLKNLTTPVSK